MRTEKPRKASPAAKFTAAVDLPTPPLWEVVIKDTANQTTDLREFKVNCILIILNDSIFKIICQEYTRMKKCRFEPCEIP